MDDLERVYEAALQAVRSGDSAAVATVIGVEGPAPRAPGAKMVIYANGRTIGTVGGGAGEARVIDEALAALREGWSRELEIAWRADGDPGCAVGLRVFIEVLVGQRTICVIGAGHIGQAVAELGAAVGYAITVVDDRADLVKPERFPAGCDLLVGSAEAILAEASIGPRTYVVIVTPHQSQDELALAVLARKQAAYVGLLGSRRRSEATFERARLLGVAETFLAQVHTPIGLDIGAETPREIAVSILAQIIAVGHGVRTGDR